MKTLGLIGGTSWHSTIEYYRAINEGVHARLGGSSSARRILYSVNFEELKPPTDAASEVRVATELASIARRLESAGAACIVLCANTPHLVADDVQRAVGVPLLHIAEPIGAAIVASGLGTVGLLGTRPTMERGFIKDKLAARSITTVVPDEAARAFLHASIVDELSLGIFSASNLAPEQHAALQTLVDEARAQASLLPEGERETALATIDEVSKAGKSKTFTAENVKKWAGALTAAATAAATAAPKLGELGHWLMLHIH